MKTDKEKIIDHVLKEQQEMIAIGDFTVLYELLQHVPIHILKDSLSEANDESVTK